MTTPKLGMPELSVSQASKEITHNQALAIVDQVSQLTVVSRTNTPPGSPADGAAYIVTATATGAWAGKEGQIAYWLTAVAAWQFIVPANGWLAWSNADSKTYRRESGVWVELSTGGTSLAVVAAFAGTSKTLALTDINTVIDCTSSSAVTITIPPQSSVAWTADAEVHIRMSGTGAVSIAVGSGVTIPPLAAPVALAGQGAIVTLKRRSADVWAIVGVIQGNQSIFGNLDFSGNSRRLTALMDASANSWAVQTNVANGATAFEVIPNGTATTATIRGYNKSDKSLQFFTVGASASSCGLTSWSGGGSQLPLAFNIGLSASWQIDPASPYALRPGADNTQPLGTASFRASVIYAGTGTINTSDAREKTAVRELAAAEIDAAKQLSKEIGAYRFLSAVAEKGDSAREHIGMTVQRAIEVMEHHGLDPFGYGFICFDSWGEVPELCEDKILGVITDSNGIALAYDVPEPLEAIQDGATWTETSRETVVVRPYRQAGDRYSFRPDELLMFIARGLEARLSELENS